MSRRYLITGAQGLVGRYLAARVLEREPSAQIVGLGRSERIDGAFTHMVTTSDGPGRAPLPPSLLAVDWARVQYVRMSLRDDAGLRAVLRELRPHVVFHLASALHTAPEHELIETNVEGTSSLLRAIAEAQGSSARLVLGSSASVYGEPAALPLAETAPCAPVDTYGVTKLAAEHLTRVSARRAGFPHVVARIFNVVGPGQTEHHVCARFAAQLASFERTGGGTLQVGPLETTRDFIDVRDVADALLALAERGERGGTYNVASGRESSIREVLTELVRISGLEGRVEIVRRGDHPAGVTRHVADVRRLQQLGFEPRLSLGESLSDLYRYERARFMCT